MTHTEKILFILPVSRELQFPAMGTVQEFVNTFQSRAKNSDVSRGKITAFELHYAVSCTPEDWHFFEHIGLKLDKQPSGAEQWQNPDMVVNMSEDRLNAFKDSGKHVQAVCSLYAGVECPSLPKIRAVAQLTGSHRYLVVGEEAQSIVGPATAKFVHADNYCECEELVQAKDKEWTGVIAMAGWETYLAASMGLACIEVLPEGRPMTWISKWLNPAYRVIDGRTLEVQRRQLSRAVKSVEYKR